MTTKPKGQQDSDVEMHGADDTSTSSSSSSTGADDKSSKSSSGTGAGDDKSSKSSKAAADAAPDYTLMLQEAQASGAIARELLAAAGVCNGDSAETIVRKLQAAHERLNPPT